MTAREDRFFNIIYGKRRWEFARGRFRMSWHREWLRFGPYQCCLTISYGDTYEWEMGRSRKGFFATNVIERHRELAEAWINDAQVENERHESDEGAIPNSSSLNP